jgi:hypothetical protein
MTEEFFTKWKRNELITFYLEVFLILISFFWFWGTICANPIISLWIKISKICKIKKDHVKLNEEKPKTYRLSTFGS